MFHNYPPCCFLIIRPVTPSLHPLLSLTDLPCCPPNIVPCALPCPATLLSSCPDVFELHSTSSLPLRATGCLPTITTPSTDCFTIPQLSFLPVACSVVHWLSAVMFLLSALLSLAVLQLSDYLPCRPRSISANLLSADLPSAGAVVQGLEPYCAPFFILPPHHIPLGTLPSLSGLYRSYGQTSILTDRCLILFIWRALARSHTLASGRISN